MWPSRLLTRAGALLTLVPSSLQYAALSDQSLRLLEIPPGQFDIKTGGILSPILIPRVSGTEGNLKVQQYFFDFARNNLPKWTLSTQNSTSETPRSNGEQVPFTNIILTREPPWASGSITYLTLVAHFDSKWSDPEGFIGATDSAAPCAMILHAAQALDKAMDDKWAKVQAAGVDEFDEINDVGIQLLLLDGEEAFMAWSATDSLYGARSLAEQWENEASEMSAYSNRLGGISLFVLLDLLGAAAPTVPSYFRTTNWAYQKMADVESRLKAQNLLKAKVSGGFLNDKGKEWHNPVWRGGMIEDDHIPFMKKGVEILHMIPTPFPRVWHKAEDDGEHLDIPTVEDWAKIITAFTAEWLELDGFLPSPPRRRTNDKTEL